MAKQRKTSRELAELRAGVEQWREREGGGRGRRIPEALWQEALRVAHTDGVYATARATGLNYQRLKERSGQGGQDKQPKAQGVGPNREEQVREEAGDAKFMALPLLPGRIGSGTTIELSGSNGVRMRIEVAEGLDIGELVHKVWSGSR